MYYNKIIKIMFKNIFYLYFSLTLLELNICACEPIIIKRQKMILSLSQEIFIKNIILLKEFPSVINSETITFTKALTKSNIYISFLSPKEIKSLMNNYTNSNVAFSKTLILTFNKEFNNEIYKLVMGDEKNAPKFLWLVWNNENEIIIYNNVFYIPYNIQLLIARDDIDNKTFIKELYHPHQFSEYPMMSHFGNWSERNGLEITEKDFYKRRLNMNGTVLYLLIYPVN